MFTQNRSRVILIANYCFVAILLALPFSVVSVKAAAQPIVLKFASIAGRNMPTSLGIELWAKEIEKRTNGRLKFEFYWSGTLLKPSDQLKGTGTGLVDVSLGMPTYTPHETPLATIGDLGYITTKGDAVARTMTDFYHTVPYFRNELERHNVKVMFFVPFPPPALGSTKPIRTLEDLKGKKIRAIGVLSIVLGKLGATPVGVPLPEVYEALSRGVVDGFTYFPLTAVAGFKLHEVCKYYVEIGFGSYAFQFVCMNKNKWDSLPADIRKIIEDVNAVGIDIYMNCLARTEPDYIRPLKEAGCSFYVLPSEEVSRWKNLIIPGLWNDWIESHKNDGPSKDFFDRFVERVKYYEPRSTYTNPFPGSQ